MKRKHPEEKLSSKRSLLIERTALALGVEPANAEELLRIGRQQSLRLNPLAYSEAYPDEATILSELKKLGWEGETYPFMSSGYTIEAGLKQVRDSSLVNDGLVYIQNAASWLPVLALDPQPDELTLDVCAAPGGKASHIAAVTNNQAILWVNDNSLPRLAKIKANFKRLNVKPSRYTLYDARYLTKKIPEETLFDKILLDAPCSGDGMIDLSSDKEMSMWSVGHIKRLQTLQKQLIMQAWHLLKPGGTLVYNTCTMAPEENELVIDYLLRKNPDAQLYPISLQPQNRYPAVKAWNGKELSPNISDCLRLSPSNQLEAFFVAKITKSLQY